MAYGKGTGTIQSLVNSAGDVVAKLSEAQERMRVQIDSWNELAGELDAKLRDMQEKLDEQDALQKEVNSLRAQKEELSQALGGLKDVVNRLAKA